MIPCIPYLSYLSYIPHIPYICNIIATPTIHTIPPFMPYIPYLPYIPNIPYFPNMPNQTDHTHHTYPTYHTTPPPHHRGGGGTVPHPHHTTGGGGGDGAGSLGSIPPFPSIGKLLAAFLRSSFVFARSLQHFWLPASHLLGTCYLLGDLRSTYTPSKYLRDAYVLRIVIYIYMLCIYFLFTTCVLWQHYMCLTYTAPTIHPNDAMHTIPIIPIIHTTYTIHMQHNCHT